MADDQLVDVRGWLGDAEVIAGALCAAYDRLQDFMEKHNALLDYFGPHGFDNSGIPMSPPLSAAMKALGSAVFRLVAERFDSDGMVREGHVLEALDAAILKVRKAL